MVIKMEELIEVRCTNCGKVYMAEYDYTDGGVYAGCPQCGSQNFERISKI